MWDRTRLSNVHDRADLTGQAIARRKHSVEETVRPNEVAARTHEGWSVVREGKSSVRISKAKSANVLLEDRVWSLMWSLGFTGLSGAGGALLTVSSEGPTRVTSQIDVLALDDEACVAIECKSRQTLGKRDALQEEMGKHALIRERLANAVKGSPRKKRSVALGFWTSNALLSPSDRERARAQNMILLTDADLVYYEDLAKQIGTAARYQLLADFLPGRSVAGLSIRVPALSAKMGGFRAYTFTASPDWLLKVAYVSHRARGKSSDVRTYQRMIKKRRLAEIRAFLAQPNAIFPTNLVISLEGGKHGTGASFEPVKQDPDAEGADLGWLTVRPTYKSAWVIDGQHRLYAYSGHPRASRDQLTVVAFEGLPGSVQQQLFIDINSKQKSVKPSLLQELYADINRDSGDPRKVTQALISESVQLMDGDPRSPLFGRVLLSDESRTESRCISMTALFSALEKPGLYYRSVQQNLVVVDPGPFWSAEENESIKRTTLIVDGWLGEVRDRASSWWNAGAGPGGGLAMNDGVAVCINVLRSVVEHVDSATPRLSEGPAKEAIERLRPYASALGDHFANMSDDERRAFRGLRGNQGQAAGLRHAQKALQDRFPSFNPAGLSEFLELERERTNDRAMTLVNRIDRLLMRTLVAVLKDNLGSPENPDAWWYDAVPLPIRQVATKAQEDDRNRRGSREAYFNLIHYRDIIENKWVLLGPIFGRGKRTDRKSVQTAWLVRTNEIRQIAAHGSSGANVSLEQLSELQQYHDWLYSRATGEPDDLGRDQDGEDEVSGDKDESDRDPDVL